MLLVNRIFLCQNKIENLFCIYLDQDGIRNDKIAQLLQRRQEYDERENNRALNEFRALHQQPCAQSIKMRERFQLYFFFVLSNRRMGSK